MHALEGVAGVKAAKDHLVDLVADRLCTAVQLLERILKF